MIFGQVFYFQNNYFSSAALVADLYFAGFFDIFPFQRRAQVNFY